MDSKSGPRPRSISKIAVTGAVVLGVAAGSYGVASAASGSDAAGPGSSGTAAVWKAAASAAPSTQSPWGGQRSDETLLSGNAASKVTAAAKAKLPNATIVRVETDADGNAAYEAHMVEADGSPVTVYVDHSFAVVSVEAR